MGINLQGPGFYIMEHMVQPLIHSLHSYLLSTCHGPGVLQIYQGIKPKNVEQETYCFGVYISKKIGCELVRSVAKCRIAVEKKAGAMFTKRGSASSVGTLLLGIQGGGTYTGLH